MTLVLETGAGVPGANSYITRDFVTAYLTARGREAENGWSTAGDEGQDEYCILGSQYNDSVWGACLRGSRLRTTIRGRAAKGTITFSLNPSDGDTISVGLITLQFVDTIAVEDDILIGSTLAATLTNAATAISGGGDGVTAHEDTRASYEVDASVSATVLTLVSKVAGANGNAIAISASAATASAATLAGGIDEGPQPMEFPRSCLYFDGSLVVGVPYDVKAASAEYTVIAAGTTLDPIPLIDDSGRPIRRRAERFFGIAEEYEFDIGSSVATQRRYPAADRLMEKYVVAGGTTFR